jgi:serine/threonine protein kinase
LAADTDIAVFHDSTGELIAERYEVLDEIGRGGQALTFLARDRQTDERVVLKELDLRRAGDWKAVELFEREGEVLRSLAHPAIPRYIDAFQVDGTAEDTDIIRFFLAQEFVPGESLRERIEAGRLLDEEEARRLLVEIFDVLDYLHSKSPPVVHRDIKPANIIMRDDGGIALVDFGAVQEVVQETAGGDTIVGTSGFLPPEQLMGKASPASDLYALGATVVYAMGGVHPADMPMRAMRLDYRGAVHCSAKLDKLLEKMLEPAVEDRLSDVRQAREQLSDETSLLAKSRTKLATEPVTIERDADTLTVTVAPRVPRHTPFSITALAVALVLPFLVVSSKVLYFAAAVPILAAMAFWVGDFGVLTHVIELTPRTFSMQRRWGLLRWTVRGRLDDLHGADVYTPESSPKFSLLDGTKERVIAARLDEASCRKMGKHIEMYLDEYNR